MRRVLTGCLVATLLLINTLVLIGPLLVFALLKLLFRGRMRDRCSHAVMWIAETWAEIDKLIFRLCIPPDGTFAAATICVATPRTW